ncbi:MAG: hypothetical protein RJA59_1361 [Pseudomonadota bacterium]
MTALLVPLLATLAVAAPAAVEPPPSPAALDVARAITPRGTWDEMLEPAIKQGRNAIAAKLLEGHIAAPPAMLDELTDVLREAFSYDAFIDIFARSLGGIYTPAELDGLATFYRSDLGKRLAETMPLLQRRVGEEAATFLQSRIADLEPRVSKIVKRYVSGKN